MQTQNLESVQFRLVEHYIGKLQKANTGLQHNRRNSDYWFQFIEQDWAQIRNWQRWTFGRSAINLRSAQLCASLGIEGHEYVYVRQSPAERLSWYRQALEAAQQSGDGAKARRLLYHVGTTAYQTGGFEEAEACGKRLLAVGRAAKDQLDRKSVV